MPDARHPTDPLPRLDTLGLRALVFDLDGVVTSTARLHFGAWKALFDAYLETRDGPGFAPFTEADYMTLVDGRPRYEGVAKFLASRGIELPHGSPNDAPEAETVCGLGNRKNIHFNHLLTTQGAEVFPSSVRLIERLKAKGLAMAVNSSSRNCQRVLETTGLLPLFDAVVDGVYADEHGLPGKPQPETFLAAARLVGAEPATAAVFEDAVAGVRSARAGGFRLVVGIDRGAGRQALLDGGADVVVTDLGEFNLD
ncbi:beta-phosphoglucomutase family hydrolase [Roseospirillum parvum]|uniref:Haloacid dehalogenase superfamily, subfamily IA, variant 3 with third motif having DD or ED/beta-phosphoglucomutase family hydrolase n=1 Tax=Roseospirillum parvum TaxID=83401 RepID=A0A1G8CNB1_9PROT|nr:beta-phosphoglucomutase family hydrolase [Roseospirillum parvum]SDH47021.1 haloacid dehalogenase superfamily, subfamily IA, variant 3 with third motif having DD or ED/beta-phosphoglucomutase family hydrolase [Roseospirillum parvum]